MNLRIFTPLFASAMLFANILFAQLDAAKLSLDMGKISDAKTEIDKAMLKDNNKEDPKAWYYKALVYGAIANDQSGIAFKLDNDALGKTIEAIQKAEEFDKKPNAKGKVKERWAKELGEVKGKIYEQAYNVAVQCHNKDDKKGAMKAFAIAYDSKPTEINTIVYATSMAIEAKDNAKFKEYCEKVVKIPVKDFEKFNATQKTEASKIKKENYWESLVNVYYAEDKNYAKSAEYAKAGLAEFPTLKYLQQVLIDSYKKDNKPEEAVKTLEELVSKNPNDVALTITLASAYESAGKIDQALEIYKKSLASNPNSYEPYYNAGVLHYNKATAIRKELPDDMSVTTLNKTKGAKEKYDMFKQEMMNALPLFEKANQLKPKDLQTLGALSNIYYNLGQKEKATKISEEIKLIDK